MTCKVEIREGVVFSHHKKGTVVLDEVDYRKVQDANGYLVISTSPTRPDWFFVGVDIPSKIAGQKKQRIGLNRFIMRPAEDMEVDHKDGDSFNNRRDNLRVCTRKENSKNRKVHSNNKLGLKGVTKDSLGNYFSTIRVDGAFLRYGPFPDKEIAAKVYDQLALEHFREYARFNYSLEEAIAWRPNFLKLKELLASFGG